MAFSGAAIGPLCTGWPNPLCILSGFALIHPGQPRVLRSSWAFGHRNRDSLPLTALISMAQSLMGAERLRNLGCGGALTMHPSPWGDHPGAMAHVPASAWELMPSTPQVGAVAPAAPMWEGSGGLWGGSHCLASHMFVAETWQAPRAFSLFFNNPCIHPEESQHWHLNCLSGERSGRKATAPRQALCLLCPLPTPMQREANA